MPTMPCRKWREATVNCRIMPGVSPDAVEAELKRLVGEGVEVTEDPTYAGRADTGQSPLRADVAKAYQDAVRALNGKDVPVVPFMSTGATDGAFFREAGMPVYGIDGSWVISPRGRARPRPRRAHAGPRRLRQCAVLGDGAEGSWPGGS